jgi:hypothetical protein
MERRLVSGPELNSGKCVTAAGTVEQSNSHCFSVFFSSHQYEDVNCEARPRPAVGSGRLSKYFWTSLLLLQSLVIVFQHLIVWRLLVLRGI